MKRPFLSLLLCTLVLTLSAENAEHRQSTRHEIRLGWGEPVSAILMNTYSNDGHTVNAVSTGNFFFDYSYHFSPAISIGMQVDFLPILLRVEHEDYFDHMPIIDEDKQMMLSFLPTFRYTYFHSDLVDLYSSLGVGFSYIYVQDDARYDAPFNPYRHYTCASFDVTAIGVKVGRNHWFGSFELGALMQACDIKDFWGPSRILSASVGYRF